MIRTFRIPHQYDFTDQLSEARIAVDRVMKERISQRIRRATQKIPLKTPSSPHAIFSDLNLKSTIIAQLVKKYWNNKRIKKITRDPNIQLNHNNQKGIYIRDGILHIPPMKVKMDITHQWFWDEQDNHTDSRKHLTNRGGIQLFPLSCEISGKYIYLTCETLSPSRIEPKSWLGVDLNATGDLVVVSDPKTGQVKKYGKEILHKKERYVHLRANAQRKGKRKFKHRERDITTDYIKRITREMAQNALYTDRGIRIEGLLMNKNGVKKRKGKRVNGIFSRFPFYKFRFWLQHFCDKMGVVCEVIDPRYTSQACSRCGCIGHKHHKNRVTTKRYECIHCGHVDHADANAGFNIANIGVGEVIGAWSMICG